MMVTPLKIRSELLNAVPLLRYHFGTAQEPRSPWFSESTEKPEWKQVHGTRIATVTSPAEALGETDGLCTKLKIPIGIVTADCLPVLLSRVDGRKVATVHAGWRGLHDGILSEWARNTGSLSSVNEWVAVIGPSIRACCYEVEEALIAQFTATFPTVPREILSPSYRKLNLAGIAERILLDSGIREVEVLPYCTFCHLLPDSDRVRYAFHSYRREKNSARQVSSIQIG